MLITYTTMHWTLFILFACYRIAYGRDGYSFFKFSGPVSGDIQSIPITSQNHGHTYDYIAKPDYFYSYGVEDPYTGNAQAHKETRDGNTLYGEYSLMQPDGTIRTVRYTSDPQNGFQATVEYSNKPI